MNQKNLSVKNKTHKLIKQFLKNKKILKIFQKFEKSLKIKENFAVAVSGGSDSLSLSFLSKAYSIKNRIKVKFLIVDHKLRKESSIEAKLVKKHLKRINGDCKILNWLGNKPNNNIQSIARINRYNLLIKECKKNGINHLLLGHHLDDLFENFFIRLLRGSGLNGLISLDKKTINYNFKILRPLLDFEKKDLEYLSKKVFNFYIDDPSNKNENFKRIKIRNLLTSLSKEGLDKKKFLLTISNLKDADKSIRFYVQKNIEDNSSFLRNNNKMILNQNFFNQSQEVIFRSLNEILNKIGHRYYPVRGKSLSLIISKILDGTLKKSTLGGCFIEKINETVIISKEA